MISLNLSLKNPPTNVLNSLNFSLIVVPISENFSPRKFLSSVNFSPIKLGISSVINLFILSGKVSTNSTILGMNSTNPASADSPKNLNIGLSNNPPALILGLSSFGPVNFLPVPADANDAYLQPSLFEEI